jgi:hypothetical protein
MYVVLTDGKILVEDIVRLGTAADVEGDLHSISKTQKQQQTGL